jgi:thiamine-phosphate diphosphorylase
VTDRRRLSGGSGSWPASRRCLIQQAHYAIEAGVDYLQVRERDLEAGELGTLVQEFVAMAAGTSTRVIVNDRLDVALSCGAGGVHLRGDSVPAATARRIVPPGFLVGASVHRMAEALIVSRDADYLVAGTVWPTSSKPSARPDTLLGVEGLARIAAAVDVPVLAIGGVTTDRLATIARAGAAGVAAISLFLSESPDRGGCRALPLRDAVKAARAAFDTPRSDS